MPQKRNAFTLIELLVVIVVIILLAGLLIPVIRTVKQSAYNAKSQQNLMNIGKAIDAYYMTFNAYPGPLTNFQILQPSGQLTLQYPSGGPNYVLNTVVYPAGTNAPFGAPLKVTMSENLVLGLLGGLSFTTTPAPLFVFDSHKVGKGPGNLNPNQIAKSQNNAFMEVKPGDLSTGHYSDSEGDADDSEIPEFLDGYPNGMPILYLRARVGANTPGATDLVNPVMTDDLMMTATPPRAGQYDLSQIIGYTKAKNFRPIGVGKDEDVKRKYKNQIGGAQYDWPNHGLQGIDPQLRARLSTWNGSPPPHYPYDAYAYILHPSIPNTPRQKDGYILIGAGKDRIYGTEDDITSFGSIAP